MGVGIRGNIMATRMISTIGYEGSTIESFVKALKRDSINLLIDVRDLPLSRKKGFSKNHLSEILEDNGIQYIHLRGLGDPKEGRLAARAGNYKLFEKIFGRHLKTEVALKDMETAAKLVRSRRACLMCFECEHEKCHRSIVADSLAEITGLTIKPMKVQDVVVKRIATKPLQPSLLHA